MRRSTFALLAKTLIVKKIGAHGKARSFVFCSVVSARWFSSSMSSGLRDTLPAYRKATTEATTQNYDYVVVGAGIVGLSAGLHLAKNNRRVLILEQFPFPHTRGCSHGHSRITRSAYSDMFYARLMPPAMKMWKDMQEECGRQLFMPIPVLNLYTPPFHAYKKVLYAMKTVAPDNVEELDSEDIRKRYPMLKYGSQYRAILDTSGGALLAGKAVLGVQELFLKHGGDFKDNCKVTHLRSSSNEVSIETNQGTFSARSVVLCTGTFTNEILKTTGLHVPVTPIRVPVCYWKEKVPGQYSVENGFPIFRDTIREPQHAYAIPSLEYPGYCKVLYHFGVSCDPNDRDRAPNPDLTDLKNYIKEHLPGLEHEEPAILEVCTYSSTPDEVFIVDRHPRHSNIIIGTGFSGTGFKTAPIIGKALAELAMNAPLTVDISPFALSRFGNTQQVHAKL